MNWNTFYMHFFHTTSIFGINMGFWLAMSISFFVVVMMNIIVWNQCQYHSGQSVDHKHLKHYINGNNKKKLKQ